MSETTETKIKFGYLSYDEMLARIESGELNEYDVIYSKDRLTTFVISEELKPIEIRSRVYVYNSVGEAVKEINENTDTYIGQIVSILEGNVYRGYIVNQNTKQGSFPFTVKPLTDTSSIDYNTLGNRPIENIIGSLEEPIIISELSNGIYSVKGQYKIADTEETIFLAASSVLFIVEKSAEGILIKKITSSEIIDYSIKDSVVSSSSIVTRTFLEEQGFITAKYVDEKIAALDFIKKEEVNRYVNNLVISILDTELDTMVGKKIDEKIQETSSEQIDELFINK